jgi:hypothetical protein
MAAIDERVQAIERLVTLFKVERITYLCMTGVALVMLLGSAAFLIVRNHAALEVLVPLFGSAGLFAYSIGRVLHMWDQAIKLVASSDVMGKL